MRTLATVALMEPYLEMLWIMEPVSLNLEYKYVDGTILGNALDYGTGQPQPGI